MHADGSIYTNKEDSTQILYFLIDGAIKPDTSALNINLSKLELFYSQPRVDIVVKNIKGNLSSKRVSVDVGKANINGFPLSGDFEYIFGDLPNMNGKISLLDYNLPSKIFSQFPLQPELSKISAIFEFKSDMKNFIGNLDINNESGSNQDSLFKKHVVLEGETLLLTGNEATLNIKGMYQNNGHFNGTIQLDKLNVSQWITKGNETDLSGYILLDGDFINNEISVLDMNFEVDESILFEREPSSISGGILFSNMQLEITNPLTLTIGPSIIEVEGTSNFNSKNSPSKFIINWS